MKKLTIRFRLLPPVSLVLSAAAAILFYAARETWVFVDIALGLEGFTLGVLIAMIAVSVAACTMTAVSCYNIASDGELIAEKKSFKVLSLVFCALSVIFMIIGIVFFITMATKESAGVYFLYLKKSLFKALFLILIPLLALFAAKLRPRLKNALISCALIISMLVCVFSVFPFSAYKFTSEPFVIDTGDCYSVVFSTSDVGTGYVQYTYNGEEVRLYDAQGGRICGDSRIHSINVPYEELNNNTYTVGSVRVIEQYSYGSRLGKEITSKEYTFKAVSGSEAEILVLSDWHTMLGKAYEAASCLGEYDALILLGDCSPGLDFEEEAVTNIVEFAGTLTHGEMPVIYARGNHETRGAYAAELCEALGMNEFYYTASLGDYTFVVLDSGEDKEDSHPEYGSMNDYAAYRSQMVDWLCEQTFDGEKLIALSHSWRVSDVEPELSQRAWDRLDEIGVTLMLSGHTHNCRLLGETDDEKEMLEKHPDIIGYMDGGKSGSEYVASKLTLGKDGFSLLAYSSRGEKVFEQSF